MISPRFLRFLFFGGSAALLNVVLMYGLVDVLGWDTWALRNAANVVSVELSLLYSFVVYRHFVWNSQQGEFQRSPLRQLVWYHGSAGLAVLTRWLILFPGLDILGVNHLVNTIFGAALSCVLNYVLSSRFVFMIDEGCNEPGMH